MATRAAITKTAGKHVRAGADNSGAFVPKALDEAQRAGLLDGQATIHVSFRAPKALVDAAKQRSGATRPTELGLLALATLAQVDPVAEYMRKNRGKLGADHTLDY